MKKITKLESESLKEKYPSHIRAINNPFTENIRDMKVWDILHVSSTEWVKKTNPSIFLGNYRKRLNRKFTTRTLKEEGKIIGWLITRTE